MSKYINTEKLKAHIEAKMETLWDKLPDADKEHPTDIELRDLGMYMALEGLIDDLDSLQQEQEDIGEVSDGYHTFNELYYYRMLYNAAFFNLLPKGLVHKSKRHHTGEECFGGGWFIVMANLPTGQVSNHYELKYWDLFKVPEKEYADEWDGHTPQEAADRLYKYLQQEQQEELNEELEKQKYDRMKPIYDARDSFESALTKAWKEYNDSGSRTVDGCEDNYVECAHAKGFREGYLFGIGKPMSQSEDVFKIWGTTEKEYLTNSMDKVHLEMEISTYLKDWEDDEEIGLHLSTDNGYITIELDDIRDLARYFYELGKNSLK